MNLSSPQHFLDFTKLLSNWKSSYRYASVASIAIKADDGVILSFGRIILDFAKSEGSQPFRLETSDLIARKEDLEISEKSIDQIIADASRGEMSYGSEQFRLKREEEYFSSSFFPLYHPLINTGPRLPTVVVQGVGRYVLLQRQNFRPFEHFDWALKAADQPFDTLDELLIFMGLPRLLQMSELTTIEIVARSPVSIRETSQVEGNKAVVTCRLAEGLDPSLVKLGYKVATKGLPNRAFVTGDKLSWKKEGFFQDGTVCIALEDVPVLQAFVSYAGLAVHQWWVTDPNKAFNIRKAAYEPYDNKLEVIRKFLAALGNNKSEDFETGIALLLYLLGFSIAHMGTTKLLSEGPDILASAPSGNILILECTIGLLNEGNKLAKLARRTSLIKEKLMAAGYGHLIIQPVIATALVRNSVQAELEEAGKAGIAVVCKEELDSLLNETTIFPDAEELLKRSAQLIPKLPDKTDQPSLFSK
jgi:hypothetical protein